MSFIEELFTPIPTSTESNSARLALDWLQKCESSHRDCNENRIGPETEFPTRLLYVGLDVRSKVVKLCEAATIKEGARYTTLSHCWGDGVPTRLFSSNYQEFRNGYRLSYLPRTFQEAIKFTRELGIEYVWIDSLCIIQDDEADWGREASRMRDVYACGYLNIAANAADNSNGGLFQSRNPLAVMPFRTQLRWEAAGWVDEDVALFPLGGAFKQLDYAPLTTRAWCVQERLLSRRTVHFTEKQLLWECTTMSGSESDATGAIEKLRRSDDGAIQGWAIAHPVDTMEQVYSSLDKWATAVNLYTRGNLTYQKDKLIAVAGVAKAVQLMFQTPCSYLAGIWNYYAFHWILWEVVGQGSRPADEIAPSWSWASVNGVIHMPSTYRHAERGLVRLSNLYSMKTFPVDDRFGRVNGGFLQVKGSICAIDLIKDAQNPPVYSLAQFQHVEVNMDEAHYQLGARWPTRHHILGWTIEEQLLHPPMSGLILRKTGAKSGEYVRVGMWSVKHFEDIEEWFPGFRAGTAHKVEGWAKCDAESDDFFGILDEFNAMHLKLDEYEEADQASCQYRISIV